MSSSDAASVGKSGRSTEKDTREPEAISVQNGVHAETLAKSEPSEVDAAQSVDFPGGSKLFLLA